jgi:hypothetical protein
MACHSCKFSGFESFTNDASPFPKQTQLITSQCVYTTQGAIVCNANTEYDKWMAKKVDAPEHLPGVERPFYEPSTNN